MTTYAPDLSDFRRKLESDSIMSALKSKRGWRVNWSSYLWRYHPHLVRRWILMKEGWKEVKDDE